MQASHPLTTPSLRDLHRWGGGGGQRIAQAHRHHNGGDDLDGWTGVKESDEKMVKGKTGVTVDGLKRSFWQGWCSGFRSLELLQQILSCYSAATPLQQLLQQKNFAAAKRIVIPWPALGCYIQPSVDTPLST